MDFGQFQQPKMQKEANLANQRVNMKVILIYDLICQKKLRFWNGIGADL